MLAELAHLSTSRRATYSTVELSAEHLLANLVLQEAVAHKVVSLHKIDESRNIADLFTKYLKYKRWKTHIDVLLNADRTVPRAPVEWRL